MTTDDPWNNFINKMSRINKLLGYEKEIIMTNQQKSLRDAAADLATDPYDHSHLNEPQSFFDGFIAGYDFAHECAYILERQLSITGQCDSCEGCRNNAREALNQYRNTNRSGAK